MESSRTSSNKAFKKTRSARSSTMKLFSPPTTQRNNTRELISRDYYWPRMNEDIADYVRSCHECARNKPKRHAPYGLLKALPIPDRPWDDVTMDFVVGLPESGGY